MKRIAEWCVRLRRPLIAYSRPRDISAIRWAVLMERVRIEADIVRRMNEQAMFEGDWHVRRRYPRYRHL